MIDQRQEHIIAEATTFVQEHIRPFAGHFEEQQAISYSLITNMGTRGYLAACFPKEYGGLELDPVYYGRLTEQIGKGCSSVRAMITVHTSLVGETLLKWGNDQQKKKYLERMATGDLLACFALSEPEAGSDAKNISTTYVKENNYYIISGKKKWITMGMVAHLLLVIATDSSATTSAFLVDRELAGIRVSPIKGLLGNRAAYVAEIEFDHVEVPKDCLLGKEGNGFTFIVNSALDSGRYSVAWGALGLAQEALEAMVSYARTREQFKQKLAGHQLVRAMIGDAVTKVHASRTLCLSAGALRKNDDQDATMQTNIAKYYSSTIASQIAADAVQLHGGNGCHNSYPVERIFRETKILEIIEGSSEIQKELIGNYGLSQYHLRTR